jgi:hypothetical protein
VIKDCCYIDERGRLVEKGNLIVSGNKVTASGGNVEFSSRKFFERLMNSRQERKSRSR